jgi:hypothetical protein
MAGTLVLNGIASIQFAGDNLLISHPESGALFTEYTQAGWVIRSFGRLRDTGFENDRDLHLALNAGLPLVNPKGGFYYVFLGGRPMFRKYDAKGMLLFERHIEGTEIDPVIATLPTRWPTRRVEDRELPLVQPTIRACSRRSWRLALDLDERAIYLRLRRPGRQGADGAVQRGGHGQSHEPLLHD